MFPLGLMAAGEKAEIADSGFCGGPGGASRGGHAHRHGCPGCGCGGGKRGGSTGRIEDMGIRPGKTVEMLCNEGGRALLVKVDETRIAIGRAAAMKIMVRRKDDEPGRP